MTLSPDYALTFTSFDDGIGPGGWQVRDEWPAQDREFREFLLAGVRTDIIAAEQVPSFPTRQERDQFPRRLEQRTLNFGRTALWHAIPAGPDSSGRPGNVFVTAIVLSRQQSRRHRGIEFWRSPSFLEPFGRREVSEAGRPETFTLFAGPLADPALTSRFLLPDYPEPVRTPLLLLLLDAVDAATRGGPGVALRVGSADEAAQWIAAVCALASPPWSSGFTWSTWERASGLDEPSVRTLHLVGVPRDDPLLRQVQHGRIVIDAKELEEPRIDAHDSDRVAIIQHRDDIPSRGDAWSVLAAAVTDEGPDQLTDALREITASVDKADSEDPRDGLRLLRGEALEVPELSDDATTIDFSDPLAVANEAGRPFDRTESGLTESEGITPAGPRAWHEDVALLSRPTEAWNPAEYHQGSAACRRSIETLEALGLDPRGTFLTYDFIDNTARAQLAVLVAHATGGRARADWDRVVARNLLAALRVLDSAGQGESVRRQYVVAAFTASAKIDLEGGEPQMSEENRNLLFALLQTGPSTAEIWKTIDDQWPPEWGDLSPTPTARYFRRDSAGLSDPSEGSHS